MADGGDDNPWSSAVPLPPPQPGQYAPPPGWGPPVQPQAPVGYGPPPGWGQQCQACGAPVGSGIGCQTCGQIVGAPPGYRIATPAKRLGEYLLELLLIVVTLLVGWVVWSVVIWSRGQTPAKQLLGMRVYTIADRRPAGWGRMALREVVVRWILIGVISAVTGGVGFIVAALLVLNTNRQTLWDLIAQTVVVDEP
jgi:RDD family